MVGPSIPAAAEATRPTGAPGWRRTSSRSNRGSALRQAEMIRPTGASGRQQTPSRSNRGSALRQAEAPPPSLPLNPRQRVRQPIAALAPSHPRRSAALRVRASAVRVHPAQSYRATTRLAGAGWTWCVPPTPWGGLTLARPELACPAAPAPSAPNRLRTIHPETSKPSRTDQRAIWRVHGRPRDQTQASIRTSLGRAAVASRPRLWASQIHGRPQTASCLSATRKRSCRPHEYRSAHLRVGQGTAPAPCTASYRPANPSRSCSWLQGWPFRSR